MMDSYWYRWLVGGMWIRCFGYWCPVLKENQSLAEDLLKSGKYCIEDHRYFRRKA